MGSTEMREERLVSGCGSESGPVVGSSGPVYAWLLALSRPDWGDLRVVREGDGQGARAS